MDSSTSESATSSSFQDLTKLQLHSVPVFGRDKELEILHVSYVNLNSISFTTGSAIKSRTRVEIDRWHKKVAEPFSATGGPWQ